tara:strand:+ start:66 stop:653 length:588 start_codon:yes stop_codon:yes gene_type:complete
MSKDKFSLSIISKNQAADILLKYHYLKDISKGFKSGVNFGLFNGGELVGCCIFTGFPVPELTKGIYGLDRSEQSGFYELSRLCLTPDVQINEHNIASWFVSRCIKQLRKEFKVRAVLSYADESFHQGTIYKALNFKYYGLSAAKKDFWILQSDGSYIKHSRGKTKGIPGEWRPRTQKHRFLLTYDKSLSVCWAEQ